MAKEYGYRSRACFKLIQINKKYGFLEKANAVIDLCAAPGGWLQVAAKFCPVTCTKIGLDLVPIKPIPGVKTYVQDITAPVTYQLLKRELKGGKADVVLNDGAPNVGANWQKDAFNQIELTLAALKLAVYFLRRGGTFVTKVFRSKDYNALIWVCNKFFRKIEANKPKASRFTSAEIFIVCTDFIDPDFIDDKLFDAKYIFKDTEDDYYTQQVEHEVNSIDKIMAKRRKRVGYGDNVKQTVFQPITFQEFVNIDNPFAVFLTHNAISFPKDQQEKYIPMTDPPKDWETICEDILVIGKREIAQLIKWRNKILHIQRKSKEQEKKNKLKSITEGNQQDDENEDQEQSSDMDVEENEEDWEDEKGNSEDEEEDYEEEEEEDEDEEEEEEDDDDEEGDDEEEEDDEAEEEEEDLEKEEENQENKEDVDEQLAKEIREDQKKQLKKQRKQKEKLLKGIAKKAIGVEFANDIVDEELYNMNQHKGVMDLEYVEMSDEDKKTKEKIPNKISFKNSKELEQNLEAMYEQKQLRQQISKKKKANKDEAEIDDSKIQVQSLNENKFRNPHLKENEEMLESGIKRRKWFDKGVFNDDFSDDSSMQSEDAGELDVPGDSDIDNDSLYDEEDKSKNKGFINPLKKSHLSSRQNGDDDDDEEFNFGSEDEQENDKNNGYIDMYDDTIYIGKRPKSAHDDIDPDEKVPGELSDDDAYIIQVPKSDMEKRRRAMKRAEKKKLKKEENPQIKDDGFEIVPKQEDYDIDNLAETLALAKKMQRKRAREDIIDSTYSRYAFEDQDNLPTWFIEDEKQHNFKHLPITKEEIQAEKERLMAINRRAPKKIIEAKIRNYKRMEKKMKKAKNKANQIMETEGISEQMKIKQVKSLYAKEKRGLKQEKKYIVGKKGVAPGKNSRFVKHVDNRLKKDRKALSRLYTNKGSRKRQIKRHKGKKQKN
ncbi:hypothetical protein ABPG72_013854 [Tetrahymena utriculariae]